MSLSPEQFSDWRSQHRPADPEYGAPMHDVEDFMPDFYSRPKLYDFGEPGSDESIRAMQRARGNPDKMTWIHRAMPTEAADSMIERGLHPIQPGDWVTPSKTYAKQHIESNGGDKPWRIVSRRAPAKDLYFSGDSVNEWGYHGPSWRTDG